MAGMKFFGMRPPTAAFIREQQFAFDFAASSSVIGPMLPMWGRLAGTTRLFLMLEVVRNGLHPGLTRGRAPTSTSTLYSRRIRST